MLNSLSPLQGLGAPHPRPHGSRRGLCSGGAPRLRSSPGTRGPKQAQYLFPVQAVAAMFRGKFLAGLKALRTEGALEFHGRLELWRDPAVWERTLGALHGTKWNVFGKGSVAGPESVLEYLGRYTHRVAISNGRLVRMDDRTVTFRYKDYRNEDALKEMTLDGVEFVRRLSLHILPAGFTKIRHYGILGNNRRATLVPLARQALEKSPWRLEFAPVPQTPLPEPEPSGCPRCGSENIVCVGQLDAGGHFTGLRKGAMQVRLRAGQPPAIWDSS